MQRSVTVGDVCFGNTLPMVLIAGPCVIESEAFALSTAHTLREMAARVGLPFIYKSSFDKANRTSSGSPRGPGLEEGLRILAKVRSECGVPVITDVHEASQAKAVAEVADMLQTPAFLCRQTDFIQAVAAQGRPVNLKKGQFLDPSGMARVAQKAAAMGNQNLLLCERGFAFGYNNLIVDMRGLAIMTETGYPVVFDATHSVQLPGGQGESSGGERRFVATLARSALAVGVAALFLETHPDPDHAPCDGPNMIPFAELEALLVLLRRLDETVKSL